MLHFSDGSALCSDTIGTSGTMAPAQILGFVRHQSRGTAIPHLVNTMGLDSEETKGRNSKDNAMYVVVHASSIWLSLDILEEEVAASFVLGNVGNCLYIVDVKYIIANLFVLRNIKMKVQKCVCYLLDSGVGFLIGV